MKMLKSLVLVAGVTMAAAAFAHSPKVGVNGGPQTDAGALHVEIVAKGKLLTVFLRDHGNQTVSSADYKGTAIFVVEGKPQRIPLSPAGENRLSGTAEIELPNEPKGAVQLTMPKGPTVQAKFN
jgi:hypothetical protein